MQAFNWKEERTQEKEVTHDVVHAGVLRPLSRVPSPHGLARADGNSRPLPLPHFDILYSPQFSSALKIKKMATEGNTERSLEKYSCIGLRLMRPHPVVHCSRLPPRLVD